MGFIDSVYLLYTFVGLYMIVLMFFVYFPNRKKMFKYPLGKPEPVSVIVPCYNAAHNIGKTIDALLNLDYPKNMIEIIVVDDASTDNSKEVIQSYVDKHKNVRGIFRKENFGMASGPTNQGIRAAEHEYILVTDDDSSPEKDALKKMIGFLQKDKTVGAVTPTILVKNPKKFIEKLQAIEYIMISFSRKLLDFVDSIYVTPGPFALYKKKVLLEVGLFDEKNMTQDIEIVWRLLSHGYKARMVLGARTYVDSPKDIKSWWRQRIRWNIGGAQTMFKYKRWIFRENMLGRFILPFFSISLFIGLFGLGMLVYLLSRRFIYSYLSAKYSATAETAIIVLSDLSLNPSILNFFGIVLFIIGLFYTLFGIYTMSELRKEHMGFYSMTIYLTIYLSIYPINLIHSLIKMARKNYSW